MGLRKRLREKAGSDLHDITTDLAEYAQKLCKDIPGITARNLMLLTAGGRVATLREKLVTALTNHKERELEEHYNRQQQMDLVPKEKGKSK